jgi:hypothetical protein
MGRTVGDPLARTQKSTRRLCYGIGTPVTGIVTRENRLSFAKMLFVANAF